MAVCTVIPSPDKITDPLLQETHHTVKTTWGWWPMHTTQYQGIWKHLTWRMRNAEAESFGETWHWPGHWISHMHKRPFTFCMQLWSLTFTRLKPSEDYRGVNHSKWFYIRNHSSQSWAAEQFLRPFNLHRDCKILPPHTSGSVQPATSKCSSHASKEQEALLQKDDRQLSSQTDVFSPAVSSL